MTSAHSINSAVYNHPVPVRWRLAGAVLFVSAGLAFRWLGGGWASGLAWLLAPDLSALAFLISARAGVAAYNAAHHMVSPSALLALSAVLGARLMAMTALIWLAHIGMDRMVGYGLKSVAGSAR